MAHIRYFYPLAPPSMPVHAMAMGMADEPVSHILVLILINGNDSKKIMSGVDEQICSDHEFTTNLVGSLLRMKMSRDAWIMMLHARAQPQHRTCSWNLFLATALYFRH